jgi:hypothetical protein
LVQSNLRHVASLAEYLLLDGSDLTTGAAQGD